MPLVHQLVDPRAELILLQGVDDVGHIGSWQVVPFSFKDGKCLHYLGELFSPLEHGLHLEPFEVRHCDYLDVGCFDPLSQAGHQVS